jgi:hypothetical protein
VNHHLKAEEYPAGIVIPQGIASSGKSYPWEEYDSTGNDQLTDEESTWRNGILPGITSSMMVIQT